MKHYSRLLIMALFMLIGVSANANARSCYSAQEAAAEQGIRIHSELMVIGLNCMNMRFTDGTNLYLKYKRFTEKNHGLFSGFESTMLTYYRNQGISNPEGELDTLRTELANSISDSAVQMRPDKFCNQFANRIFYADSMGRQELRQWASTIYDTHPVSRPLCR